MPQSVNLVPLFAAVVIGIMSLLKKENSAIFKSGLWTRLISTGIGGALGFIYWFAVNHPAWNWIIQSTTLPLVPIGLGVAVAQGLFSGFLGTVGVAFLHQIIDRNNTPIQPTPPPIPPPTD